MPTWIRACERRLPAAIARATPGVQIGAFDSLGGSRTPSQSSAARSSPSRREVAPVVALGKAERVEIRSRENAGARVRERALGVADFIRRVNLRAARRARDVDRRVDAQAADRREHRAELLPIDLSGGTRNRIGLALFPEQMGEREPALARARRSPRAIRRGGFRRARSSRCPRSRRRRARGPPCRRHRSRSPSRRGAARCFRRRRSRRAADRALRRSGRDGTRTRRDAAARASRRRCRHSIGRTRARSSCGRAPSSATSPADRSAVERIWWRASLCRNPAQSMNASVPT